MEISKLYKPILSGLLCTALLSGFTGKEKFVELESLLNGRSSVSFSRSDNNIITTLPKGTRGEIMDTQKLRSGSYGIKIKVLNGKSAGQEMWVYHRDGDSDLALYDTLPENWDTARKTKDVSEAQAAVAQKNVRAAKAALEKSPDDQPSAEDVTSTIEKANQKVANKDCDNCSVAPTKAARVPKIRKGSRDMAARCSRIMNSQGEMGPDGQTLYNIMSQEKNLKHYVKNNSLGNFCPRFNQFSDAEKLQAWVWFWTALGQEESGCRPNLAHGTRFPDGRVLNPRAGWGMWTMEKDRNVRRDRGPECSDIASVSGQARCSIEIMKDNQLARGYDARSGDQRYWGPTKGRRADRQMMPHMKRFVPCFQK